VESFSTLIAKTPGGQLIGVLRAFYIEQIQNIKKYQPKKKYK